MTSLTERCAEAGLKMTGQRKIILRVLDEAADHPAVETVYERARVIDPSISMATVYRTLNLLDELNLVVRHEFNENFARYETNTEHHHHLIDVESGAVIEFQNDEIEAMKIEIATKLGYELVECRLELYGRKIKKAN
jgi:Fur family ferric uptake transcriptional regulator